jgi:shikimate dehydrogenase
MTASPRRIVLLGGNPSRSLSPAMMAAAFRAAGIDATYDTLQAGEHDLPSVIGMVRREGLAGNVTIPLKEAVAAVCDRLTDVAASAGAVNTFWMDGQTLVGHNTDVIGFDRALRGLLAERGPRFNPPRRVVLLGAGGAAAAVLSSIQAWDPPVESVVVTARNRSRGETLARRFPGLPVEVADAPARPAELGESAGAPELPPSPEAAVGAPGGLREALVVNATPVGMTDWSMPCPVAELAPGAVVLDLVYRPGGTEFVRQAREAGHLAADGLRMLVEQGAAAIECWFGIVPDRDAMWSALAQARGG